MYGNWRGLKNYKEFMKNKNKWNLKRRIGTKIELRID